MTQVPSDDRLSRIEEILNRTARLTLQNTEAIAGLQATAQRHDREMFELRGIMTDLATQQQRTDRSLQALSQTQVECLQLIAANTVEINRIWQYLERQTGNGRSGDNGGQAN